MIVGIVACGWWRVDRTVFVEHPAAVFGRGAGRRLVPGVRVHEQHVTRSELGIDKGRELVDMGTREIQNVRVRVDDLSQFVRSGETRSGPYSRSKSVSGTTANSQFIEEPTGLLSPGERK